MALRLGLGFGGFRGLGGVAAKGLEFGVWGLLLGVEVNEGLERLPTPLSGF